MIDNNTQRKAWVMASIEVLEDLRAPGWSRPVQVQAPENPDGSWEMTFRALTPLMNEEMQRERSQ